MTSSAPSDAGAAARGAARRSGAALPAHGSTASMPRKNAIERKATAPLFPAGTITACRR